MFSGIVEGLATLKEINSNGKGKRIVIDLGKKQKIKIGESVSVNGVCLTATTSSKSIAFDLLPETLKRTTLGQLKKGDKVNIERSMKASDRNSGHFVMGHVDTIGNIIKREDSGDFSKIWIKCSKNIMDCIAEKGSIALDGVSLTVIDVGKDSFSVALIPHTMKITTLGTKRGGDEVNIEIDMLARYVKKILGK